MATMRVLIVDDDSGLREVLASALLEAGDWQVEQVGFDGVEQALLRFRPDLVVLDLVEGAPQDGKTSGNAAYEAIWETWFCPVVVYSGYADTQEFEPHAFVSNVTKGDGTEAAVIASLRKFIPDAEMIRAVHRDFDARVRKALRDSVSTIRRQTTSGGETVSNDPTVQRAVRRLVAADIDAGSADEGKLHPWERLVVPPLGANLLTADLLKRNGADWTEERAFRLVLTPSCDLVRTGKRSARADQILVATCEPLEQLGPITLPEGKKLSPDLRDKVRPILTAGMVGQHLVIPRYRDHVPLMVANLKRLELLSWDEVCVGSGGGDAQGQNAKFDRVASTDSPFREMVVWAYLLVTGRPGLPDFDVDTWLDEISDHVENTGDK